MNDCLCEACVHRVPFLAPYTPGFSSATPEFIHFPQLDACTARPRNWACSIARGTKSLCGQQGRWFTGLVDGIQEVVK